MLEPSERYLLISDYGVPKRWIKSLTLLVLVIAAAIVLYLPGHSLLPNLWFLFWFAGSGLLLRQYAVDRISNP